MALAQDPGRLRLGALSLSLGCLGCSAVDRLLLFCIESAGCGAVRVPACPLLILAAKMHAAVRISAISLGY